MAIPLDDMSLHSFKMRMHLMSNSLHIFEQNLQVSTVIEFGGPAVGVAGDSLSCFQGAASV